MFNVACGLTQRVPLTKLIELDSDVHPYLAALIIATLAWVGKTLVVLEGMHNYDDKGSLQQYAVEGGQP